MAPSDDNTGCSFVVFQHHVERPLTCDVMYSPTFTVQNMKWCLAYHLRYDYGTYLGLHLKFQDTASVSLPMVNIEFVLKIINHLSPDLNISQGASEFYDTSKSPEVGFNRFVSWENVTTTKGFLKEDVLLVEVQMAATPPQANTISLPSQSLLKGNKSESPQNVKDAFSVFLKEAVLPKHQLNSNFADRNQYLLDSEIGSNCTFMVGKDENMKCFLVNTFMLARISPVFETMFYGNLKQESPVEIPDAHPDAFYKMLQYAYGCEFTISSQDNLKELYYLAHKYLIADLEMAVLKQIWPNDKESVLLALEIATNYDIPVLLNVTLKVMNENITAVLSDPDFCTLSAKSVLAISQAHGLNKCNELKLFQAIMNWASINSRKKGISIDTKSLRGELHNILPYIRFLSMSLKEFVEGPATCDLLSQEEKLQCFLTLVDSTKHQPPSTLCALRNCRKKL